MKNLLKLLMPGMLIIAFITAIVPSAQAQDQTAEQQAVYQRFLDNWKGPDVEKFRLAIAAGDEFIRKYGSDANNKDVVDYINKRLPKLKDYVAKEGVVGTFNSSVTSKNWDNAFSNGKQVIALNPDDLDVMLVLASIGYDRAYENPPVDKYNDDTIAYSKKAIEKLNENKASGTGQYGAFGDYVYKSKAFPDGRNNALGYMNYYIGYIMYNRKNMKKEALPYLYKATQVNSATKNVAEIYRLIGTWYLDEFNRVGAERKAEVEANKGEDTDKAKSLLALQKGYAERAMEAFARAYKVASADPKEKPAYKTSLLNRAKEFYAIRFDKKDGADAYIASLNAKPFTDPSTAVIPVVSTTAAAPAATSVVATPAAAAPAATTTMPKTVTTATKTPAKKPAVKKKGTR